MVSRCLVFVLLPKSLVSSLSIDYLDLIHKNFKKLDMTMTTFSLEQDRNKRLDYVAGVLDGADSSFEVEALLSRRISTIVRQASFPDNCYFFLI